MEERTACDGCRYFRNGKCVDWTVAALLGGEPIRDDMIRKCFEDQPASEESDVDAESV